MALPPRIVVARRAALCAAVLGLTGCVPPAAPVTDEPEITVLEAPSAPAASVPELSSWQGRPLLSWIESAEDGPHRLRFAWLGAEGWSEPRTVVADERLLVNWADFPSLVGLDAETLGAHWLVRTPGAGFAYGLRFSVSSDSGAEWSPPLVPHPQEVAAEYGFVSLVPDAGGALDLLWLDGRELTGPGGRMLLVHRHWNGRELGPETIVDADVCTCCQTSAARLLDGLLVAYRDHTEGDVRDISTARLRNGRWESPRAVHDDGWRIGGCPVNGPAIDSVGSRLALAWFTSAADQPRVLVAFSADGGESFSVPVRVDGGAPLGRVDLQLDAEGAARVVWLEEDVDGAARVLLRRVAPDGVLGVPRTLGRTGSGRASGFPRIVRIGERLWAAWTGTDEPSGIRLVRVELGRGG